MTAPKRKVSKKRKEKNQVDGVTTRGVGVNRIRGSHTTITHGVTSDLHKQLTSRAWPHGQLNDGLNIPSTSLVSSFYYIFSSFGMNALYESIQCICILVFITWEGRRTRCEIEGHPIKQKQKNLQENDCLSDNQNTLTKEHTNFDQSGTFLGGGCRSDFYSTHT